jgi:hypothetical protein
VRIQALRDASLRYFGPVAGLPGFSRALARTLQELRLTGLGADAVRSASPARSDLADLLARFDASFADVSALIAQTFSTLRRHCCTSGRSRHAAAARRARERPRRTDAHHRLIGAADAVLATGRAAIANRAPRSSRWGGPSNASMRVPPAIWHRCGASSSRPSSNRRCDSRMAHSNCSPRLAKDASASRSPPHLQEARRGVRFDEMAVFVRSPRSYFGLLEHALHRAEVPAWFDRGTRRPIQPGARF